MKVDIQTPMQVQQNPEKPVEETVLAEHIVRISDALASLLKSGLNRDAIILLLRDRTRISKRDIEKVLKGLQDLKTAYTTKR